MKNFNKDLFMHDKAVVKFEDAEEAKEFFEWANHNDLNLNSGHKYNITHFHSGYYYDFKNGRIMSIKEIQESNERLPGLYSVYYYSDILIKLRVKEKGETVKCLFNNKLKNGIVESKRISIGGELKYKINAYWFKEEKVFFPSENLKVEITEQGIIVTGEEEPPEMPVVCPWCDEEHWLTEVKHNHWRIEYEDTKNCILSAIRFVGNKKTAFESYKEICNGKT